MNVFQNVGCRVLAILFRPQYDMGIPANKHRISETGAVEYEEYALMYNLLFCNDLFVCFPAKPNFALMGNCFQSCGPSEVLIKSGKRILLCAIIVTSYVLMLKLFNRGNVIYNNSLVERVSTKRFGALLYKPDTHITCGIFSFNQRKYIKKIIYFVSLSNKKY